MTAGDIDLGVVIADAGPIIALSHIGHLTLLRELFVSVWITETVRQEIMDGGLFADTAPAKQAIAEGWINVVSSTPPCTMPSSGDLDAGELSSIAWALVRREEGKPSLLILDDAKARNFAMQMKLPVVGTAGIIGKAKMAGLIPQAASLLWSLPQAEYFVAPNVIEAVLRQVGELPEKG